MKNEIKKLINKLTILEELEPQTTTNYDNIILIIERAIKETRTKREKENET